MYIEGPTQWSLLGLWLEDNAFLFFCKFRQTHRPINTLCFLLPRPGFVWICKINYPTHAIVTSDLYTFYPFFKVFFLEILGLCMVSIQERVIVARVLYVKLWHICSTLLCTDYRHPERAFFSKIRNFCAWADKLDWNLMRHLGYFWPNYKQNFSTVSPLSMGKCSWFSSLQKTLVFRSKTYNSQMLPK